MISIKNGDPRGSRWVHPEFKALHVIIQVGGAPDTIRKRRSPIFNYVLKISLTYVKSKPYVSAHSDGPDCIILIF